MDSVEYRLYGGGMSLSGNDAAELIDLQSELRRSCLFFGVISMSDLYEPLEFVFCGFRKGDAGLFISVATLRDGVLGREMYFSKEKAKGAGLSVAFTQGPRFRTTEQKVWMMLITLKHGKCKATR